MREPTTDTLITDDGLSLTWYHWQPDAQPAHLTPLILQHGLIGSTALNWTINGTITLLLEAGFEIFALDSRGHGASDAPHNADLYGEERMARDLEALIAVIGSPSVALLGYGMGAAVAAIVASRDSRVRRLILGGVGQELLGPIDENEQITSVRDAVSALLTEDRYSIAHDGARQIRSVAELSGGDRHAYAAAASKRYSSVPSYRNITAPTLVVTGSTDALAPNPTALVEAIPNARLHIVAGDHFDILGRPDFVAAIDGFVP